MKLILLIYPFVDDDQEKEEHFNSRLNQSRYFCDHCLYFSADRACRAHSGLVENRYQCVKFKKDKLKKL